MENFKLVEIIVKILSDKKATNIVVIDVSRKSSFTDYLILASGGSLRQLNSLVNDIEDKLAENEVLPKAVEGKQNSDWLLMDYADVVVNVLTEDARERYNIERVWGDCDTVDIKKMI
ncbi:MAG: ribosome silencing factor [Clostridiales bacterium]|nr:ribosome silencing factor [Clostridiales bacterium]MDY4060639.1 ribosome silencing factor [Anaerovoracaceae bacterium]